ncbi:LysE family translocator [Burkholderia cepacia]|uniref:LysE family translocator n=1 Tax=Burkholderia cepacia TaxID=292 RepID=UPI001E4DB00E|nr:LysE family transporter [Burkholderia cepacia]
MSARASNIAVPLPPQSLLFRTAFLQGVATNIANPKSIAFYAAVSSSPASAHVPPSTIFAMLATVGVTATCWYGAIALDLSHVRIATMYRRVKSWIDRLCGGLIIALGSRQAIR